MIHFDLETRSSVDLRRCGGHIYAESPDTRILVAAHYDDQSGEAFLWLPMPLLSRVLNAQDIADVFKRMPASAGVRLRSLKVLHHPTPPPWLEELARRPWVAWNGFAFDRPVWRAQNMPQPSGWSDPMRASLALGFPGSLDLAGFILAGARKDPRGEDLLKAHSIPDNKGSFRRPNGQSYPELAAYCLRDVMVQAAVCARVVPLWMQAQHAAERELSRLDDAINERGISADRQLAIMLLHAGDADLERRKYEMASVLGVKTATEVEALVCKGAEAFQRTLTKLGGPKLPTTNSGTPKTDKLTLGDVLLSHGHVPEIVEAIELRQAGSRSFRSKAEAALRTICNDGKMRGMLRYAGARTLRWSGAYFQPQNLPSGSIAVAIDESVDRIKRGLPVEPPKDCRPDDVFVSVTRSVLVASPGCGFVIADLAGIELRTVYYIAHDMENLRTAVESDVYCKNASSVFARTITKADKAQRQVGKILTLSGVYGAGEPSIAKQMAKERIDLRALGVTAAGMRDTFREANPVLKQFWSDCAHAVEAVIRDGEPAEAGRIRFEPVEQIGEHPSRIEGSRDIALILPSGGVRYWRNVRIQKPSEAQSWASADDEEDEDEDGEEFIEEDDWQDRPTIFYDVYKGKRLGFDKTYGGKICQFANQAWARDILADAITQLEREGIRVIGSVHDELIIEAPLSDLDRVGRRVGEVLTKRRPYAPDLPLGSEIFCATSYRKSPQPGMLEGVAKDGGIVKWGLAK